MTRCQQLGLTLLNFHPGSHLQQIPEEECGAHRRIDQYRAGEDRRRYCGDRKHRWPAATSALSSSTSRPSSTRVGVCIDTCHAFAAGYDLRSAEACEKPSPPSNASSVFSICAACISTMPRAPSAAGSTVTTAREGNIGHDCFSWIMQDSRFDGIPLILETINPDIWAEEIAGCGRSRLPKWRK